jgi:hypothetical protein
MLKLVKSWRDLNHIIRGADLSDCGTYRYRLWRRWSAERLAGFIMLNPSKADAVEDDPTIMRCMDFAFAWNCGGIMVVNLFALRSPRPDDLLKHGDPVGPHNDQYLFAETTTCKPLIAAWGNHGHLKARGARVRRLLGERGIALSHLGLTKDGSPKHPLARGAHRIPSTQQPIPWT